MKRPFFSAIGRFLFACVCLLVFPVGLAQAVDSNLNQWPSEKYASEFTPRLNEIFKRILVKENLQQHLEPVINNQFKGLSLLSRQTVSKKSENGISITTYKFPDKQLVNKSVFLKNLQNYANEFDESIRMETHIKRVKVTSSWFQKPAVSIQLDTTVKGKQKDQLMSDQVFWKMNLKETNEGWQFTYIEPVKMVRLLSKPAFTEITGYLPKSHEEIHPETLYYNGLPAMNGVSLADWDNDGDLDIYLFRPRLNPVFYENDGSGNFKDVSHLIPPRDGIISQNKSGSGYFFDADNDGDLDFLELQRFHRPRFFIKSGNQFIDKTEEFGALKLPESWFVGAAIADYDKDGDLDIYLTRYKWDGDFNYFNAFGVPNILLENKGDLKFEDVTLSSGMHEGNDRMSFAAAWGDYNNDNLLDLYVANDYGPNRLYQNLGNGKFKEVAANFGIEDKSNGMGVSWGDFNNDGQLDIYISNMHSYAGERITHNIKKGIDSNTLKVIRRFAKGNTLFANNRTSFQEPSDLSSANGGWAWGNAFFDYDYDGDLDIAVVNGYFSNAKAKDT